MLFACMYQQAQPALPLAGSRLCLSTDGTWCWTGKICTEDAIEGRAAGRMRTKNFCPGTVFGGTLTWRLSPAAEVTASIVPGPAPCGQVTHMVGSAVATP